MAMFFKIESLILMPLSIIQHGLVIKDQLRASYLSVMSKPDMDFMFPNIHRVFLVIKYFIGFGFV
jgi:hypothetical protein